MHLWGEKKVSWLERQLAIFFGSVDWIDRQIKLQKAERKAKKAERDYQFEKFKNGRKNMSFYRKKPVVIQATQWFVNGDHPEDGDSVFLEGKFKGKLFEGKVVRYYRRPEIDGETECKHCGRIMHDHGWVETLEGGHIVCPGDFIITGVEGERYPIKSKIFEKTYERVDGQSTA